MLTSHNFPPPPRTLYTRTFITHVITGIRMFTAADVCSDDKDSDTLVSRPVVSSYDKRSLEFENFNKTLSKISQKSE